MHARVFGIMTSRSIHSRRAFTLIEVLATIALLGIVLPVAMQGVSIATGIASTARHRSEASALAESKMNELIITQQWANGGTLSGDCGPDFPEYTWQAQVIPWNASQYVNNNTPNTASSTSATAPDTGSAANNPPQQLDVRVTWRGRTGDQYVQLSTLVYQSDTSTSSSTLGGGQ
jgi:prepilin-type N-terminal cleavage/methylation domain-containing protein